MDFTPYNLRQEIATYFDQWQEDELDDETRLTNKQLQRLVSIVSEHANAAIIYSDFDKWFNNKSDRADVMSEAFTDILDAEFSKMFDE